MRLIMLGPQGAGKGTQAQRLAATTGALHISTGDLVRAEIARGSALGQAVKGYNDRGELVPDTLIMQLVEPALTAPRHWILDGFPRDERQARILDAMLAGAHVQLDRVIVLDAPDDELITRLLGRRQSRSTGKVYNLVTDPPPADDPGPFVQRDDDTPADIARRLAIYHRATKPLEGYYAAQGLLQKIDARGPIDAVADDILRALRQPHGSRPTVL